MGMAAQQEIEPGVGGLLVDFGRMRKQNRKLIVQNTGGRLLDVVHAIKMSIVDADKMQSLAHALDRLAFVHQHAYSDPFKAGQSADGVVIAENAAARAIQ